MTADSMIGTRSHRRTTRVSVLLALPRRAPLRERRARSRDRRIRAADRRARRPHGDAARQGIGARGRRPQFQRTDRGRGNLRSRDAHLLGDRHFARSARGSRRRAPRRRSRAHHGRTRPRSGARVDRDLRPEDEHVRRRTVSHPCPLRPHRDRCSPTAGSSSSAATRPDARRSTSPRPASSRSSSSASPAPRRLHAAVVLRDGNILVAGGISADGAALATGGDPRP